MAYHIIIQRMTPKNVMTPSNILLQRFATKALQLCKIKDAEITLRIVDATEIITLNKTYRHKDYATNVLSFPAELPADVQAQMPMMGDIAICAEVVNREADEQRKELTAYWAHMVVHGILHCLGHDHEIETDATRMENLEIKILTALHFANPYENDEDETTSN
jgi:probable rRNA maturation factor